MSFVDEYLDSGMMWICRVCGCTDEDPCPGGCFWIAPDLCSRCASKEGGNP